MAYSKKVVEKFESTLNEPEKKANSRADDKQLDDSCNSRFKKNFQSMVSLL